MAINEKAKAQIFLDGKQAEAALEALQKKSKDLAADLKKAVLDGDQIKAKKIEKELKGVNSAISGVKKEAFSVEKVLNNLNGSSVNDLGRALRKANSEFKRMKRNDPDWDVQKKKVLQLKKAYNSATNELKEHQGFLGKIKSAAGGMLPAFGWGAIAAGALAAGKKILGMVNSTHEARQTIQEFTGKSGKNLADFTAQVSASAKSFDKEFDEMALATHNFAQSMGISEESAQKLIDKGFIAGADASGEFLDKLREYGPQFRAAGLSAEQSIALMTQEVKSGVFSDKGSDAIKESMLRLREMPQSTRDALDGIGISSEQLMQQLSNGEITVFEATQKVARKLGELPAQSAEVGTAIADVFGGAGEDAGIEYIKMLGNVSTGMDEMIAKTGETASIKQMDLEATQELEQAWSDFIGKGVGGTSKFKAQLKSLTAKGLQGLIQGFRWVSVRAQEARNWFIDFYNKSLPLRALAQAIGLNFKLMFRSIKTGYLEFLNVFKSGAKVIKAIFTGNFKAVPGLVKDAISNAKNIAVEGVQDTWGDMKNAWNKTTKNEPLEIKPIIKKWEVQEDATSDDPESKKAVVSNKKPVKSSIDPKAAEKLQKDYLKAQKAFNAAWIANMAESLDKELALENDRWKNELAGLESQLINKETLSAKEIAFNELINKTIEEKKKNHASILADIKQTWRDKEKLDAIQAVIDSGEATMQTHFDLLEEQYNQGLIKHKDYEEKKRQITDEYAEGRFKDQKKWLEQGEKVLSSLDQLNNARKNAELARVGEDRAKIHDINRKYAKREQKIAKGQALISGALSIMRIWEAKSMIPSPFDVIIKGVLTAAMIGTTAAQIKEINAQQFYTGGYTDSGAWDDPKGVVHSNEFVANRFATKNNTVKPVFDLIDIAQRNGTIQQMNLPAEMVKRGMIPGDGFAAGGFVNNAGSSSGSNVPNSDSSDLSELRETLSLLANAANKLADKELIVNIKRFSDELNKYSRMTDDVDF